LTAAVTLLGGVSALVAPAPGCETATSGSPGVQDGALRCGAGGECPEGWSCHEDVCTPGVSCAGSQDCVAGLVCDDVARQCRSCRADGECGIGRRCRDDGLCKSLGCNTDTDCGAGLTCDLTRNVCVGGQEPDPGDGTCRGGCPAEEICEATRCVPRSSCSERRPCAEGFTCDGARCVPAGAACNVDVDCAPEGCCDEAAHRCVRCEATCQAGQTWDPERRMCVAAGPRCQSNDDCAESCCQPARLRCGPCDVPCTEDGHCARGWSCDAAADRCALGGDGADKGRDGDACEADGDCVGGYRCFQLIRKQCREGCSVTGSDPCSRTDYVCIPRADVCLPE
jgi:hypothetical protein